MYVLLMGKQGRELVFTIEFDERCAATGLYRNEPEL